MRIALLACSQKSGERSDISYKPFFVYVGQGTLLTKDLKSYYRTAQLKTKKGIMRASYDLEKMCNEANGCVGFNFNYNTTNRSGDYFASSLAF